jgi:glycosyltransferase involved in cell wall biosynthesis
MSRILLINYEYPPLGGGAGNATAHIAREMARLGAQVMVVTSAFKGLAPTESVDGYCVLRIPTLRRHEEKCAAWEMAVFMASACLRVPMIARRFRPDAVVAFFGIPSGPSAWLARALHGAPYVVSLRGGDVPGFQPYDLARMHRLTGPVIRFLWRRAGAVAANSRGLADLARAFEPGLDYPVIPNGADTELFRPPLAAATPDAAGATPGSAAPRPVRLFFHGRVVYQKGLDVLLEALNLVPREPAWELHVAGDGPQRPELEARAKELGLSSRIFFRGWMRRPQLAAAMRETDVYAFPSRDEGMPNAVLEAMASGLPVAATAIAGCEELVIPEKTGLMVPPDSPAELAEVLTRLIADPALRAAMGRAGRERVEREYSWESVARRYLDLCESLAPAPHDQSASTTSGLK